MKPSAKHVGLALGL